MVDVHSLKKRNRKLVASYLFFASKPLEQHDKLIHYFFVIHHLNDKFISSIHYPLVLDRMLEEVYDLIGRLWIIDEIRP